MDRPKLDLQILAELAALRKEFQAQTRLLESLAGRATRPEASATSKTMKQIVADMAIAMSGTIPDRNLSSAIARRTRLSERQVRRLLRGK